MQWYEYLMIVVAMVSMTAFGLFIGRLLPNGNPVCWWFKMEKSQWYCVLAVVPSRSCIIVLQQLCAVLQDQDGLYNPFLIFLPTLSYSVEPGDLVQVIRDTKGKLVLNVQKKKTLTTVS